jgi:SAM-dependent methyltransferase
LKSIAKLSFLEDNIENTLPSLPKNNFDLICIISVLEHLWQPQQVLINCYELLKPGGLLLINVPTWRGKKFLEFSAFRLGTSPVCEMEDHKMYYNLPELWPLLVRAGFKPGRIFLKYIKFGLNLFGRAYKY